MLSKLNPKQNKRQVQTKSDEAQPGVSQSVSWRKMCLAEESELQGRTRFPVPCGMSNCNSLVLSPTPPNKQQLTMNALSLSMCLGNCTPRAPRRTWNILKQCSKFTLNTSLCRGQELDTSSRQLFQITCWYFRRFAKGIHQALRKRHRGNAASIFQLTVNAMKRLLTVIWQIRIYKINSSSPPLIIISMTR